MKMKFLQVLKFPSRLTAIDRRFPRSLNSPDVTRAESVRTIADAENRARPAAMSLMKAVAAPSDRKSTRLNSSHNPASRMPSSA
jgi:hypothetical protein